MDSISEHLSHLSPREREIAHLVACAQSNAQIGEALDISPKTVETHLRRAYERIGIGVETGRRQRRIALAVAYALAHHDHPEVSHAKPPLP